MISLHDKGNINQIYMERKQQKKFKIIEKKYQSKLGKSKTQGSFRKGQMLKMLFPLIRKWEENSESLILNLEHVLYDGIFNCADCHVHK